MKTIRNIPLSFFRHTNSGQQVKYLSVRVGTSTHARDGISVGVERIEQHQQYNYSNIDYDFSLLKLSEPLNFTGSVQPVKLAGVFDKVRDGAMCLVSGWGNTQSSNESMGNLRGAEVPIVNQRKCANDYARYGGVTPRMLCAGYEKGGKDGTCS